MTRDRHDPRPSVLIVQHVDAEGPGLVGRVMERAGVHIEIVGPRQPLPANAIDSAIGIVALGGPMGVYDSAEHPRLVDEIALLRAAVARDLPVLGICLGSQLLAAALGARVSPGSVKEIGWYDVTLETGAQHDRLFRELPQTFKALHWHGDVFDLPSGARLLASSALTAYQAFTVKNAWGLLFHLEAGADEAASMASAFSEELRVENIDRDALLADTREYVRSAEQLGTKIFTRWIELLGR